jgi:hypothetical protein
MRGSVLEDESQLHYMGSNVENKRSVIGLFIKNKGDTGQTENNLLSMSNNEKLHTQRQ